MWTTERIWFPPSFCNRFLNALVAESLQAPEAIRLPDISGGRLLFDCFSTTLDAFFWIAPSHRCISQQHLIHPFPELWLQPRRKKHQTTPPETLNPASGKGPCKTMKKPNSQLGNPGLPQRCCPLPRLQEVGGSTVRGVYIMPY